METSGIDFALLDFVLASLLMGLGIGADVAVATVARSQQLSKSLRIAIIWVVGVSFTHTFFPMFGYMLTYFSLQLQPDVQPLVGLLAFAFIFFYLKGELVDFAAANQHKDERHIMVTLGLILAVSWDALWSGPAKSAQVIGWPELFVWGSFIIVGGLVSLLAILSLGFSLRVKQTVKHNAVNHFFGHWLQFTVIGYFGLLALLRYTLDVQLFWWQVVLLSAVLMATLMIPALPKVFFKALKI